MVKDDAKKWSVRSAFWTPYDHKRDPGRPTTHALKWADGGGLPPFQGSK